MKLRRRPLLLLIISIASFITLASFLTFFSPNTNIVFSQLFPSNLPFSVMTFAQIPTLFLFFSLLTLFLFSTSTYLFKSKKHGILLVVFVITYLLFRLNHLTHPFFFILLLALFLTLELFVSNRKD